MVMHPCKSLHFLKQEDRKFGGSLGYLKPNLNQTNQPTKQTNKKALISLGEIEGSWKERAKYGEKSYISMILFIKHLPIC
jgi:hypothetical protein